MNSKTVPGQMNQPEKSDLRDTNYENAWEMTKSPSCSVPNKYAETNNCQIKAWDNNTDSGSMKTTNEINGGKGMADGGGLG